MKRGPCTRGGAVAFARGGFIYTAAAGPKGLRRAPGGRAAIIGDCVGGSMRSLAALAVIIMTIIGVVEAWNNNVINRRGTSLFQQSPSQDSITLRGGFKFKSLSVAQKERVRVKVSPDRVHLTVAVAVPGGTETESFTTPRRITANPQVKSDFKGGVTIVVPIERGPPQVMAMTSEHVEGNSATLTPTGESHQHTQASVRQTKDGQVTESSSSSASSYHWTAGGTGQAAGTAPEGGAFGQDASKMMRDMDKDFESLEGDMGMGSFGNPW